MGRRRSVLAALTLALAGRGQTARAAEHTGAQAQASTQACVSAHVEAQRQRRDHHLRAARQSLLRCARDACPRVLVQECAGWLRELDDIQPSVVVEAHGQDGREITDVRMIVDGEVVADSLDGTALELDPGEHVIRWEHAGAPPVEERIVLRERDAARRVVVRFAPPAPTPPRSSPPADPSALVRQRPTPLIVYGLGAVGIVGVGTFGTLAAVGMNQKASLDARNCQPNCPTSDVDAARRAFLVGDVALAVGATALVAAVVVYVTRPTLTTTAATGSTAPLPELRWAF